MFGFVIIKHCWSIGQDYSRIFAMIYTFLMLFHFSVITSLSHLPKNLYVERTSCKLFCYYKNVTKGEINTDTKWNRILKNMLDVVRIVLNSKILTRDSTRIEMIFLINFLIKLLRYYGGESYLVLLVDNFTKWVRPHENDQLLMLLKAYLLFMVSHLILIWKICPSDYLSSKHMQLNGNFW